MSAPATETMISKARAAWGDALPEWIEELAALVDQVGLAATAKRVGYSTSAVSTAIRGLYTGDLARIEERVRGALMGEMVNCPAFGELARDACLDWQKKPWAPSSAARVRVYRACRGGCPHSKLKGDQ
ncbi:transcriptional regulator [Breoghania sp.]|uniref:transcriptional regulator n=1 Tax=Breoghania sp. TaxID=2065378 RepID=UPI0029C9CF07|nr:transcriptional regulator [Breoghania sp.]